MKALHADDAEAVSPAPFVNMRRGVTGEAGWCTGLREAEDCAVVEVEQMEPAEAVALDEESVALSVEEEEKNEEPVGSPRSAFAALHSGVVSCWRRSIARRAARLSACSSAAL